MYENLSLIYDSYMEDVDYNEWAKYLIELITVENPKSQTILEYGCGSGNLTLPLTTKFSVVGVDLSDEMLTLAEGKLRDSGTKLYKGDLKDFKLSEKFDVAILACDTLNLLNYREIEGFFSNVYDQLNPGGMFLFDILSKNYLENFIAPNNFIFENEDVYFTWTSELFMDYIESYFTFFIKENNLYRRIEDDQRQYILECKNLIELLESTGFKNIKVYNFLTKDNVTDNSDRFQFIAQKPF